MKKLISMALIAGIMLSCGCADTKPQEEKKAHTSVIEGFSDFYADLTMTSISSEPLGFVMMFPSDWTLYDETAYRLNLEELFKDESYGGMTYSAYMASLNAQGMYIIFEGDKGQNGLTLTLTKGESSDVCKLSAEEFKKQTAELKDTITADTAAKYPGKTVAVTNYDSMTITFGSRTCYVYYIVYTVDGEYAADIYAAFDSIYGGVIGTGKAADAAGFNDVINTLKSITQMS